MTCFCSLNHSLPNKVTVLGGHGCLFPFLHFLGRVTMVCALPLLTFYTEYFVEMSDFKGLWYSSLEKMKNFSLQHLQCLFFPLIIALTQTITFTKERIGQGGTLETNRLYNHIASKLFLPDFRLIWLNSSL